LKNLLRVRGCSAASLMLAALLTACGGGGGESAPPPTAIPDNVTINAAAVTEIAGATAFTSSAAAVSGLTFAWNFGDGATSAEPSPKHDYAKAGDFDVSLRVTNSAGTGKDVKFKVAVNNRELVSGLSCSAENQSGWCWEAPRPSGNMVNDVYFLSTQVGWTVGDGGDIHKTTDGGKTWTKQPSGVTSSLATIRFADANNGWALGAFGAVLHTTDGGAHWALQGSGLAASYGTGLTVPNSTTAIIQSGNLIRSTTDGGSTWTQSSPTGNVVTVAPDATIWAVAYDGLRKSSDAGKTWTIAKSFAVPYATTSLVVRGQLVWLLVQTYVYDPVQGPTLKAGLQRSGDGGTTWEDLTPVGMPVSGVNSASFDFLDANVGAVASVSDLYRTTDGGRTWTKMAAPTSNTYFVDYQVIAPGVYRRTYYDPSSAYVHQLSADDGASWRNVNSPLSAQYSWPSQPVQRIDAQSWVAIADGTIKMSTDGMQTWNSVWGASQSSALTPTIGTLWFFDAKHGLAMTQAGQMIETLNGGRDWAVKLSGLPANYASNARIQFVDAKRGWLLAGDNRLYQSINGGDTWSAPLSSQGYVFINFEFLDASNGYALGSVPGGALRVLLRTTDGGQTWTQLAAVAYELRILHFNDLQHGVLAGDNGRIQSTDDGGKTWVDRFSGTGMSLASVASSEVGGLWIVGSGGTMLNSKDGAVTWVQAGPITTATLQKIRFLDGSQGWAVGSGGTILSTQDGGKTWTSQLAGVRQQLNDVFFTDSRSGWVAGESGTILATGTGGR
jgi:photosystem II stability/assembly factor-like uncharacterized protein